MPAKTLKAKVEGARKYLRMISNNSSFTVMPIFEALAALEARVEELEKYNEHLWLFLRKVEDRFDEQDLWKDNKDLSELYEVLRKEGPGGE